MESLLNAAQAALNNGNYWLLAVAIVGLFIFNIRSIYSFWDEHKQSKIKALKFALEHDVLPPNAKAKLQEELEIALFEHATGIWGSREYRDALIAAHDTIKAEVGFGLFRRAAEHVQFKNKTLTIHISKLAWAGVVFNLSFALLLFLLSLLLAFGILLQQPQSWGNGVLALVLFLSGLALAILSVLQSASVYFAYVLRKHLNQSGSDQHGNLD